MLSIRLSTSDLIIFIKFQLLVSSVIEDVINLNSRLEIRKEEKKLNKKAEHFERKKFISNAAENRRKTSEWKILNWSEIICKLEQVHQEK